MLCPCPSDVGHLIGLVTLLMLVEASLALHMSLIFFELLEVPHNSTVAQWLTLSVVPVAEVRHPDILEGLQVLPANGEDLFVQYPIHDFGAWGVRQGALIVEEFGCIL